MNLIGKKIAHKRYGSGTIANIDGNKMEIAFETEVKIFLYPDAFAEHLEMMDKTAENYVNTRLKEIKQEKKEKKEQLEKRKQAIVHAKKNKTNVNSQAVFALKENALEDIQNNWCVFTGNNLAGKMKGKPRIPKSINMRSACLLTMKCKGEKEADRAIVGIFMTAEDFIGENCETGWIPAHEKYRILWNEEHEKLHFWDYFPEHLRLEKWGSSEVKYMPDVFIKKILEDMETASNGEMQEKVKEFYQYFIQMNEDV